MPLVGITQLVDVIFYFAVIRFYMILCVAPMAVIFVPLSRTTLIIVNMLYRGKIIIVYWLKLTTVVLQPRTSWIIIASGAILLLLLLLFEHQHRNRSRWHDNCFTSARHDVRVGSRYRCTDIIIDFNILSQFK